MMTLKELRKALGWSVGETAAWLEVTERSIRRWEDSYTPPKAILISLQYRLKYGELNDSNIRKLRVSD